MSKNMSHYFKMRTLVKCPCCKHPFNVITSSAQSLTYFTGKIACSNVKCEKKYRGDFKILLENFEKSCGYEPATEVSTMTTYEIDKMQNK